MSRFKPARADKMPAKFSEAFTGGFGSTGIGGGFMLFDLIHNSELDKRNKKIYDAQWQGLIPRDITGAAFPSYSVWNKTPYYDKMTELLRARGVEGFEDLKTSHEIDEMMRPSIKLMREDFKDIQSRSATKTAKAGELVGSMFAYVSDPPTLAAGMLSGGLGAAARGASYLHRAAVLSAYMGATEGAIELARQPAVADWRLRMEEDYNVEDQIATIAMAAGGGAAFGPLAAVKWGSVLRKFLKRTPHDGTNTGKTAVENVRRNIMENEQALSENVPNTTHAQMIRDAKNAIDEPIYNKTNSLEKSNEVAQTEAQQQIRKFQESFRYGEATTLPPPRPPVREGEVIPPGRTQQQQMAVKTPEERQKMARFGEKPLESPKLKGRDVTPDEGVEAKGDISEQELNEAYQTVIADEPDMPAGVLDDGTEINYKDIVAQDESDRNLLTRLKECLF